MANSNRSLRPHDPATEPVSLPSRTRLYSSAEPDQAEISLVSGRLWCAPGFARSAVCAGLRAVIA